MTEQEQYEAYLEHTYNTGRPAMTFEEFKEWFNG